MAGRPVIDLDLRLDDQQIQSETTCTWAGAHVLTVHTVIPRGDLALELHSTFVGHEGVEAHSVHLVLGPPGSRPRLTTAEHPNAELDPTLSPRACAYEHAQRLIEILAGLGHKPRIHVLGDGAFEQLERVIPSGRR